MNLQVTKVYRLCCDRCGDANSLTGTDAQELRKAALALGWKRLGCQPALDHCPDCYVLYMLDVARDNSDALSRVFSTPAD